MDKWLCITRRHSRMHWPDIGGKYLMKRNYVPFQIYNSTTTYVSKKRRWIILEIVRANLSNVGWPSHRRQPRLFPLSRFFWVVHLLGMPGTSFARISEKHGAFQLPKWKNEVWKSRGVVPNSSWNVLWTWISLIEKTTVPPNEALTMDSCRVWS